MLTLLWLAQTTYTGYGDPTSAEQLTLEIINRARRDPTAEAARLSISGGITEGLSAADAADLGVRPPLAMNAQLLAAARAHSQDMYVRAFFAHTNPDGDDPGDRITAAGYSWTRYGENIAMSSSSTAMALEDLLMIDAGVAGRGHRTNLLDVDPGDDTFTREVGIGYYSGPSAKAIPGRSGMYRDFITQDFARRSTGPFLVGVVINDGDDDGFYDIGEGMSGVTITLSSGSFNAVTASAGGYALPISGLGAAGTEIVVTASGGGLGAPATKSFYLTGENVKLDFKAADGVDGDADGLPNYWEALHPASAAPASDADGDTFSALTEYRFGSDPGSAASTPANPAGAPAPPGGGDDGDGGGGGCGLTGFELVLLALLLRGFRRV